MRVSGDLMVEPILTYPGNLSDLKIYTKPSFKFDAAAGLTFWRLIKRRISFFKSFCSSFPDVCVRVLGTDAFHLDADLAFSREARRKGFGN